MRRSDVVVIGAGAAGLQCAAMAGQRGLSVVLIEHAGRIGEKIRISGGGRCNFTNRDVGAPNFFSANRDFCRSALARYTPQDFIALIERHGVAWHEKHKGQLFCDGPSQQVIDVLMAECAAGGVEVWQPCSVESVASGSAADPGAKSRPPSGSTRAPIDAPQRFEIMTSRGAVGAAALVIATGGLSIPKIGATDFGHRLARQFGHRIIEPLPALVPLTCSGDAWAPFDALAGVALPARVAVGRGASQVTFEDDLLFTHRGLSGPAALQISTAWRPGIALTIDCAPGAALRETWLATKQESPRRSLGAALAESLPRRLRETWLARLSMRDEQTLGDTRDKDLGALAESVQAWQLTPDGTEGFRKAEVTSGGVDTRELDSKTMQSRRVAGVYFIGEVVDVTGWLGGYNFHWAWASGAACARAIAIGNPPPAALGNA